MSGTGALFLWLQRRQHAMGLEHGGGVHTNSWCLGQGQAHLTQAVGTTKPATCATGHAATTFFELLLSLRGNFEAHFDALGQDLGVYTVQLVWALQQSFCERKAQSKVFQVSGAGHHHGMTDAIEHQCHRHFFGQGQSSAVACVHLPTTSKASSLCCALANKPSWFLLNCW